MKQKIIAIDIFCGCGGLTYGLRKVGIEVIKGIDIDPTVEKTYTKNNPGTVFLQKDVNKLTAKEVMNGIDRKKCHLLLAGCAPCQPFSQHNHYSNNDRRKSLISQFGRLVEKILPEYVLIENVPGFKNEKNKYHSDFLEVLEKNGYQKDENIINAADFGVPQVRRRYVLVASRLSKINLPKPMYGNEKRKYKTVRDTIKKYPPITAGGCCERIPNHTSLRLEEINLKRIKLIPKNGGTRFSLPKKLRLKCHILHDGHKDVYGRMKWNAPAPTLTCKCTSFSNGRFGHPNQDRAISIREAAALQTFPDNYVFYGFDYKVARHVGNAVPVLLSMNLGRVFVKMN